MRPSLQPLGLRCRLSVLCAGALLGLLSGCSLLPQAEPNDVYLLPGGVSPQASGGPAVDWSLRVAKPQANQVLDNSRIAVLPHGSLISSYKGARWSDAGPVLLRDRLLETFQADGRISSLSSDDRQLQADLELVSDLRAFQSEYRARQPEVVIRLDVRLVQSASHKIVAVRRFEVRQAASSARVADVVAAFGQASDALAGQLLTWTLQQGQLQARNLR
ncbi:ABC-type transport auxiliary lipoprotein family protein [Pseudomonas sp. 2FG]|uniref:ABC-type transport auxiliary lipoprotein family protein n=1 Tax=Pseudomonas sp. 2FG TaxID=2502191 RepID=UPI0010F51357|nr:ABC-type transport auxiliary lipoprotein family protein [Pseudomonas sp. 2FG]